MRSTLQDLSLAHHLWEQTATQMRWPVCGMGQPCRCNSCSSGAHRCQAREKGGGGEGLLPLRASAIYLAAAAVAALWAWQWSGWRRRCGARALSPSLAQSALMLGPAELHTVAALRSQHMPRGGLPAGMERDASRTCAPADVVAAAPAAQTPQAGDTAAAGAAPAVGEAAAEASPPAPVASGKTALPLACTPRRLEAGYKQTHWWRRCA